MADFLNLQRDTQILHAGRDPDSNHGVVNPPVYHCSTVIFKSLEELLETRRDRASGRDRTPAAAPAIPAGAASRRCARRTRVRRPG